MSGGGGSLNLEILRGGGCLSGFGNSGGKGGGSQKTMPSAVGVWIFSGITYCSEIMYRLGEPDSTHPPLLPRNTPPTTPREKNETHITNWAVPQASQLIIRNRWRNMVSVSRMPHEMS